MMLTFKLRQPLNLPFAGQGQKLRGLIDRVQRVLAHRQERRTLAAMGPIARRELNDLLLAQRGEGIPLELWSQADEESTAKY